MASVTWFFDGKWGALIGEIISPRPYWLRVLQMCVFESLNMYLYYGKSIEMFHMPIFPIIWVESREKFDGNIEKVSICCKLTYILKQ